MAMGCRLNYQTKAPKTAPYCERLPSLRLRANRSVRRNYCEPYIDLKMIRADLFDFEAEYTIILASDFYEGLRLAQQQDFDLYILDNWLPDKSGVELCRAIRAFEPYTQILF